MIKFRKATTQDTDIVLKLYQDLIDAIKDNKHTPQWIYGVYPKEEHIKSAINLDELYVGEIDSEIVSSMVINHTPNEGYDTVNWRINEDYDNIYVIHLVAVKHSFRKQGIAKKMLNYIIDKAIGENIKSLRLSIIIGNIPAEKLYQKFDFEYVDSIEVDDIDRGLKQFKLYERIL